MKISDILKSKEITVSCEIFPPKLGTELTQSRKIVSEIANLSPDFISVTYGAAGSTAQFTAELAEEVENCGVAALAHVTCVSSDEESLKAYLETLKANGIENILALRGDMPVGREPKRVYPHASDLARAIKDMGDFCIGGACYPEGHPEAKSVSADIDALKIKAESGCEFFTTQMFFDNDIMYSFMTKFQRKGINIPVIAGIMPITNARQLIRSASLSGTTVPRRLREIVERFGEKPEAMKQAGIAFATEQIIDLIANGVNNIHIYAMNKPDVASAILTNISEIIK
ncbi:MAG: methylenetetrahydrofolate reductase [Clostridia bacterium]|nr:methylenetetrahydrofolate reductase [Clostridia bacterium]MBQ5837167.1 methylenetetrahydrofolate reductase [Clostridia bacterium]